MLPKPTGLALLLLLASGCWKHAGGTGESHELTFNSSWNATSVQFRAIGPHQRPGPGYEVFVSWNEVRRDLTPFSAGLHGGGGWDFRDLPIDVSDAHCEPASLCDVTIQPRPQAALLYLTGHTPGRGELVVRAKVHWWWRSVSDRIPVTVLPPY